jgi:hypothetical protein
VTLTPTDPGCVSVESPVTIPAGLTSITSEVTYGGTSLTPCSTEVSVTASGIDPDTVNVTVNPPPVITLSNLGTLGSGLQNGAFSATLGTGDHDGVTVRIESADENIGLVAPDGNTPGFISTPNATQIVEVDTPTMTLTNFGSLGSGLQNGTFSTSLETGNHGGVTVRVESANDSLVLIAPDRSTAGSAFIDVPLNNGSASVSFWIQDPEGVTGDVDITASAPGFEPVTKTVTVVQPAVAIVGLPATKNSLDADDPFVVRIGTPSGNGVSFQYFRIGSPGITATLSNDTDTVGELVTLSEVDQIVTVPVLEDAFDSPSAVASGGVAFRPVGIGTKMVSASIPGYISTPTATRSVEVSGPIMTLTNLGSLGSGLQNGAFSARLESGNHGGVTMRIESAETVSRSSPRTGTPPAAPSWRCFWTTVRLP